MTLQKSFITAAKKRDCVSSNAVVDAIRRERSDLAQATFYVARYGNSAHILLTEKEVFKAPLETSDIAAFEREVKVMQFLSGKGIAVPDMTCVGKQALFYGMQRIDGVLADDVLDKMTPAQKTDFGRDAAMVVTDIMDAFLKGGDTARAIPRKRRVDLYEPEDFYATSCLNNDGAKRYMRGDIDYCLTRIERFKQIYTKQQQLPLYYDMHGKNIIVDPVTFKIKSIIDLGHMDDALPSALVHQVHDLFGRDVSRGFEAGLNARIPCYDRETMLVNSLIMQLCDAYKKAPFGRRLVELTRTIGDLRDIDEIAMRTPSIAVAKKGDPAV